MDREGTVRLLSAILADLPKLPAAAACRGHYGLFDPVPGRMTSEQQRERFEAAAAVCAGCRARPACPESLFGRVNVT